MEPQILTKDFIDSEVQIFLKDNTVIEGKLISIENSHHNGYGNILIRDGENFILIRGNAWKIIKKVS